jgi:hypothetical protein
MMGFLGTALCLLLAVAITFIVIRPAYRFFAPKVPLPPTSELIGIVTFLLIMAPLSALLISALSFPLLVFLAWAISHVAPAQAAAVQRNMESVPSWAPIVCWFSIVYLAVFLNGLHGFIKSSEPTKHGL